jgi:hypothetical protein
MNKLLAAMLLTLLSFSTLASDWEAVSAGDDVIAYVDKESIRFIGSTAKIWVKWEYTDPQEVKYSYPKKTYTTSKNLELYKCLDRTSAAIQAIRYSDNSAGEVVDTITIKEANAEFSEVAPDTMGESILQWVCKKKPKQKK